MAKRALESTKNQGLCPQKVLADCLYGGDENCEAAKAMAVKVISPAMGSPKGSAISLSEFRFTATNLNEKCLDGFLRDYQIWLMEFLLENLLYF